MVHRRLQSPQLGRILNARYLAHAWGCPLLGVLAQDTSDRMKARWGCRPFLRGLELFQGLQPGPWCASLPPGREPAFSRGPSLVSHRARFLDLLPRCHKGTLVCGRKPTSRHEEIFQAQSIAHSFFRRARVPKCEFLKYLRTMESQHLSPNPLFVSGRKQKMIYSRNVAGRSGQFFLPKEYSQE